MMFDVIDISDDEEDDVQFIEHVIKIEKPVVDLTTPQAKKRRRIFEREERPASSTSPATSDSSPSPSSQSSEQSDQSPPSPRPSHSRHQAPPQPQQHNHHQQQQQSRQDQPHAPPFQSPPKYFQQTQPQQRRLFFTHPQPPHARSEPDRPEARSQYDFLHQQYQQQQQQQANSQQRRPLSPNPPQPHPRPDHPFREQPELRSETGQQQQKEPAHPQSQLIHKQQQQPSGQRQPTQEATQPPQLQPPQAASDHDVMHIKKEEGNKHFRNNEFDVAIRNYKEASELAKKLNDQEMSAILHFNLAMAYDRLGAYNQAADECAAAVRLNDNYIKAHVKRANIFLVQAKFDEAVICFEHIIEIDSSKRDDAMRRIASAKELAKKTKRPDQYQVLGLRPNFNLDDLRAAYKQKARAHHPDKHSDADVVTRRIHEKIFKEASEAYSFFRKRFG